MLEALAHGCSYQEVAERYSLAYNTVASYMKTLYSKMQVSSRAEAVAKGIKTGLVCFTENSGDASLCVSG